MAKEDVTKLIDAGNRALAVFDYKMALSKFKKAREIAPDNAEAHFGYAESALGIPKIAEEEIINAYQKAIELEPDNAYYHARLGAFLLDIGRWDDAAMYYEKAAELDPEGAPYYFSEYAIGHYQNWLNLNGDRAKGEEREQVMKRALKYLLRCVDLDEKSALNLLKN